MPISDLLIGIVGSIVGGAAVLIWNGRILPWFYDTFREPLALHEAWQGVLDFGSGANHRIHLHLQKRGVKIHGLLRFTEGKHAGKEYPISGRYYYGILTFVYWPSLKDSTSQGAASFQRSKDGEEFVGHIAYFSQAGGHVDTVPCTLQKA